MSVIQLHDIALELQKIREILERKEAKMVSGYITTTAWSRNNEPIEYRRVERGEWTNAGMLTVHCSNCKSEFHELEAMNFCPNCGADMRGEL